MSGWQDFTLIFIQDMTWFLKPNMYRELKGMGILIVLHGGVGI